MLTILRAAFHAGIFLSERNSISAWTRHKYSKIAGVICVGMALLALQYAGVLFARVSTNTVVHAEIPVHSETAGSSCRDMDCELEVTMAM